MISAGQTVQNGTQGSPPQGTGYPQQQGPTVGSYAPIQSPAFYNGMPTVNASVQLDPEAGKEIIKDQQLWGGIGMVGSQVNQTFNQIFNYLLANKSLGVQQAVAEKYYDTQDKIAGYQRDVALNELAVRETAIYVSQDMHKDQIVHEEQMARLEGSTQSRLARIAEDGKTDRAKILSMSDAFSRTGWDMGAPAFAA
jgi:hypothetical protein